MQKQQVSSETQWFSFLPRGHLIRPWVNAQAWTSRCHSSCLEASLVGAAGERRWKTAQGFSLLQPRRAAQLYPHFVVRAGHRTSCLHRAENSILCAPRKKGCGLRSGEHMVLPVWGLCGSTRQSEHQGRAGCSRDGLAMCALTLALSRAAQSDCCSRQARPAVNAFGLLTLHVN